MRTTMHDRQPHFFPISTKASALLLSGALFVIWTISMLAGPSSSVVQACAAEQAVVWSRYQPNVTITGTGNSIRKTSGGDAWGNAGAVSTKALVSGDGYVQFTAASNTYHLFAGLNNGDPDQGYQSIDYAVHLQGTTYGWPGDLVIFENGVDVAHFPSGSYVAGDVFRVQVVSGQVKYYMNGKLLYTSSQTPVYPLVMDTALFDVNSEVLNAYIQGCNLADSAIPAFTPTPTNTPTYTPTYTATPVLPTAVPTTQGFIIPFDPADEGGGDYPTSVCGRFQDVYPYNIDPDTKNGIQFLGCRNVVGGYPCGGTNEPCGSESLPYFRLYADVTRAQLAKIVVLSHYIALINPPNPSYTDVPRDHWAYTFIETARQYNLFSPTSGEFRPNENATRADAAQASVLAAGYNWPPVDWVGYFEDVPYTYPQREYIEMGYARGLFNGYACGGPGEPCGFNNRPYFRPGNPLTRG